MEGIKTLSLRGKGAHLFITFPTNQRIMPEKLPALLLFKLIHTYKHFNYLWTFFHQVLIVQWLRHNEWLLLIGDFLLNENRLL